MERSNRVILQFIDQYMKKKVFFKIRRVEGMSQKMCKSVVFYG